MVLREFPKRIHKFRRDHLRIFRRVHCRIIEDFLHGARRPYGKYVALPSVHHSSPFRARLTPASEARSARPADAYAWITTERPAAWPAVRVAFLSRKIF